MIRHTISVLLLMAACGAVMPAAEPVMLSVKLVKTAAGRSKAAPRLEFPTGNSEWRVTSKAFHSGENDWEIFFEIESGSPNPGLPEVAIVAPGVSAARVIVGKTDVPFRQKGDTVRFGLVDDRSRGQLMQVVYQSPRGGHVIQLIHNWKMRRNEQYLKDPYPEKEIRAVPNYLLAAQELLRVMGDMGPGANKPFEGELVLMGSEVAATRGHMDYPQHVHIMHYQFREQPGEERTWMSRLVPHFYMDAEGRINRNSYAVLAGRGKSGELGIGDECPFADAAGHPILTLKIERERLLLIRPDGGVYSLRLDLATGAVEGFRGEELLCRVQSEDDAAAGRFHYRLQRFSQGKQVETFEDGYRYDPFTAKVLGKE